MHGKNRAGIGGPGRGLGGEAAFYSDGLNPGCGGWGHRNRYYATGQPYCACLVEGSWGMSAGEDAGRLRAEADRLQRALDAVESRLQALGQT